MKIIETPRLLIRGITIEEHNNVFKNYGKEEIMNFFGFTSEEQFQTEENKYLGGLTTHRLSVFFFHLIEKESSKVIGDCAFHNWYAIHSRSEIGYGMRAEEYKNKGYMKEALLPILDYGFSQLNLNRVEAFIGTQNIASQKLVTRYGFQQEGRLRSHYCKDGVIEDSLVFGLLKQDFLRKTTQ
jgi:[ribosomal protein S5]-alanine N-acetyltransferase